MKQKDLIYPFMKGYTRPFLHDTILVIPQWNLDIENFSFAFWEEVFAASPRVELCSGNGDWILEQAENDPTVPWIAVEMRFDRIRKIWRKAKNRGVKNLYIVHGRAEDFCRSFLSDGVIHDVHVNFPDPWPKKRHHKNRLFQTAFVQELTRVLKPEGRIKVVSDDLPYLIDSLMILREQDGLNSTIEAPFYAPLETYSFSYFKQLWEDKGRCINYLQFQKEPKYAAACSNT